MRSITINNFGPIKDLTVPLDGVVLLHGSHGTGKTSVINALTLALYGEMTRFKYKKEISDMIMVGADKATIKLIWDGEESTCRITPKSVQVKKSGIDAVQRARISYPWECLEMDPAVWKSILGPIRLQPDAIKSILSDMTEEAISIAQSCIGSSLDDTLLNLEGLRLDLHRRHREPPEIVNTTTISGKEINVDEYIPHIAYYEAQLRETREAEDREEANYNSAIRNRLSAEAAIKHIYGPAGITTAKDTIARLNIATEARTKVLDELKIVNVELEKSEVCPTCGQDFVKDQTGIMERAENLRREVDFISKSIQDAQAVLDAHRILSLPIPSRPIRKSSQMSDFVSVLKANAASRQQRKDIVVANEKAARDKEMVQQVIVRLRDPEVACKMAGDNNLDKIGRRIEESCKLLGIPKIVITDGLTLQVEVGKFPRSIRLLSDTQRTLAGLSVIEAFSRDTGDLLIVDQIDWVHEPYLGRLCQFIDSIREAYKTIVVLTARTPEQMKVSVGTTVGL